MRKAFFSNPLECSLAKSKRAKAWIMSAKKEQRAFWHATCSGGEALRVASSSKRRIEMKNTDLGRLKQIMESKLKEATQAPSWRDSITIEPSADPLDITQQTLEREMATRKLDRDAMIIRDVRAALARIELGTYG